MITIDWTMLLAYLTPIVTAVGTGVAFLTKIKQALNEGKKKINEASDNLMEANNIKQLNNQLTELAQENAELKKQLNKTIELLTQVKQDDKQHN